MSLMQKLKDLIKLSDLCNLSFFAIEGNNSHQKLRNYWVAKDKAIYPLKNFEFLEENFSETIRCIVIKFSAKTKTFMRFQYSEFLFYWRHQTVINIC